MKNKIDRFFKDKMESHSLPPSEEAWVKVEANLSKKNKVIAWRIAAAVLIMGALVSVIIGSWPRVGQHQQFIAAKKQLPLLPRSVSSQTENKSEQKEMRFVGTQTSGESENKPEQKERQEIEIGSVETPTVEEIVGKEIKLLENKIMEATPKKEVASPTWKAIKLEFTLDGISSEAVATADDGKKSGLKKVFDLARDVKNGEAPINNLRNIKDEFFAFNFKKTKNQ